MDAKMNSCWAAWESVKATKNPHKKKELLTEQFAKWREESAKAIRSYYPQYVDLAKAYPELVSIDPVEWAEDSVWDLLISAYGVKRFSDPAPGRISRSVLWWYAIATEGNHKVNEPPLRPWKAPRWLARDGKASDELLTENSRDLSVRFWGVLDDEKERARVAIAVKRGYEANSSTDLPPRSTEATRGPFTVRQATQVLTADSLTHSDDYCLVGYRGERYSLTPLAGRIVEMLHEAYSERKEGVSSRRIRNRLKCRNVWDAFRKRDGRKFWDVLITKPEKDSFKLNLELIPRTEELPTSDS